MILQARSGFPAGGFESWVSVRFRHIGGLEALDCWMAVKERSLSYRNEESERERDVRVYIYRNIYTDDSE